MDKNILKKAVELADGWGLTHDGFVFGPQIVGTHVDRMGQPAKDALAAQLVRQVDALRHFDFTSYDSHVEITTDHAKDSCGYWFTEAEAEGPDRTENTITVVVESKVLEKGEQLC